MAGLVCLFPYLRMAFSYLWYAAAHGHDRGSEPDHHGL